MLSFQIDTKNLHMVYYMLYDCKVLNLDSTSSGTKLSYLTSKDS